MKAVSSWNFTPYTPLDRPERAKNPYICRMEPGKASFTFDFIDNGAPDASHTLYYRLRREEVFTSLPLGTAKTATLSELADERDYEFFVKRDTDGAESEKRLFRTGEVPGKVVQYLHPDDSCYAFSGRYLCSPCLVRLPSGRLLSSMDVYEGNAPQNLTLLYYSDDNGATWHYLTELFPCFWGQMFCRGGRLYMLAVSDEYGDLLIGASDDEGKTWSLPTVLFRGASHSGERGLHRAPMRLLEAHGRLWTDVEYGTWAQSEMNNAVLSAPADCADYTDPAVWVMTDFWRHGVYRESAKPGELINGCAGGIEGNLVSAPDGTLYDFLRYARKKCLLLRIDPEHPEAMPVYDCLVDMEITPSKFDIQRDGKSGFYYALCSRAVDELQTDRNLLSLFRSEDLIHWDCIADILDARYADPMVVGFQYVSFLFDGDDILFLCRTAYGKPSNFHNSNYQTFHRISGFRAMKNGAAKAQIS